MATVSFENLDENFSIISYDISYSSIVFNSNLNYEFLTPGGEKVAVGGSGFTYDASSTPTGGVVSSFSLDFGGFFGNNPAIEITGLSTDINDFKFRQGSDLEQRANYWSAALAGDDIINFDLADPSVLLQFAGDGSFALGGVTYMAGHDTFNAGGTTLINSSTQIAGDFWSLDPNSTVFGGDDTFSVGARSLSGDFVIVGSGAVGVGGDDVIVPDELFLIDETAFIFGDTSLVTSGGFGDGYLEGGNDLIDLRSTALLSAVDTIFLYGDARTAFVGTTVIGGNDTIYGSSADDIIIGDLPESEASDPATLTGGADSLFGMGGNDTIEGNLGDDVLRGNSGNDRLEGGFGNDTLFGGNDNDVLRGDEGEDLVIGGDGDDTLTGQDGADDLRAGNGDDEIRGGGDNDTAQGFDGNDVIFGQAGNDFVAGMGDNDTLKGNAGDDTITGGPGADRMLGGHDNDLINGGGQNDQLFGQLGMDTLLGGAGADTLRGNGGDDSLKGGNGADTLFGGNENDTLEGGAGNDFLHGNLNADTLNGNAGNDTLRGGSGDDLFVFNNGQAGSDVISDFVAGSGTDDVIELSGFGAALDEFSEVISAATQVGEDVLINLGGGESLVIENTLIDELHQDDFIFGV